MSDFFEDETLNISKKDYDKMCDLLEQFAEAFEKQETTIKDLKAQLNHKKAVPVLGKYEVMLKSLKSDNV